MPGRCKFLWISFCCLHIVAAAAKENPSGSKDYPAMLRGYARRIKNQITSIEFASKTSFYSPTEGDRPNGRPRPPGSGPPVMANVYYKGGKMRVDLDIKAVKWGEDGRPEDIYPLKIISSYDGQTAYELTQGRTLVISKQARHMQYSGYFKVGRIMGLPMHELFENMEITSKATTNGPEGRLHNLTGLYTARTGPDAKPWKVRFEMSVAEDYGFAVLSADIYTEEATLFGRYIASNFVEVTKGIWLPKVIEEREHKPDGHLNHRSVAELKFKAINEAIDDSIFEIKTPPGGTVYERIGEVLVDRSTFSREIKSDPFDTPGGADAAKGRSGPLEDAHLPPEPGPNSSVGSADTKGESAQPVAADNNLSSLIRAPDQNTPVEVNRPSGVDPVVEPRSEPPTKTDSGTERRTRGSKAGLVVIVSALVIIVAILARWCGGNEGGPVG